jgi:hypothetical protein
MRRLTSFPVSPEHSYAHGNGPRVAPGRLGPRPPAGSHQLQLQLIQFRLRSVRRLKLLLQQKRRRLIM